MATNSNDDTLVVGCVVSILTLLLIPVSYAINGWALSILWGWFILPLIEGAPTLGIAQAIGVAMVVGFLTHQVQHKQCHDDRSLSEKTTDLLAHVFGWLFGPLVTLGIGWIVIQFL